MLQSLSPWVQGLMLASLSGLGFWLAYQINELFDAWTLYSQGVNLLFLPAGVKHVAILIAGTWGALGCGLSLFVLALEFWHGTPTPQIASYSLISTGATWLGIVLSLRVLGVDAQLNGLKFIHLPLMDLITTALHGLTTNAYFALVGMKTDDYLGHAMAMMVGDFTGSLIVLMLFWLALLWIQKKISAASHPG